MLDFARKLVRFGGALREAGVRVSIEQTQTFARAAEHIDVLSRSELYFAGRATLVTRQEDYAAYDRAFEQIWGTSRSPPQKAPLAPRHDPRAFQRTVLTSFLSEKARAGDAEVTLGDRRETASDTVLLQRRDFAHVSEAEREALRRALRSIEWRVTMRRTRRRVRARRGAELDMRRIVQRRAAQAGYLFELPRRARKIKPRPLVLLADVSGSMELYARILLQFFHGLSQAQPHAETFVFGTRLTRITRELQLRDVDQALDRVAHQVDDYAGGTRIGACFAEFNRCWSRHVLRRGAVLIIVSDGCDVGDSAQLAREMRWLRDRSQRVIWLNPRLGARGYRPLARGMAAALDYIDDFLPIHNLQALAQLAELLSKLPAQRSERGRPQVGQVKTGGSA